MENEFAGISWPGWEVVRKIGEGSFGGVYEIQRTLPGGRVEKCALKKLTIPRDNGEIEELYSQSFSTDSITAHYKNRMEELVGEYGLMQSLNGCPNTVTCYDIRYVRHDDNIGWDIYIRMELLLPLKKALGSIYSEDTVCALGIQMCSALIACHRENIIHRDIKPENIMVSDRDIFKLGDFGIAKISEKTASGTLTGSYGYMAPEVANRQHYGAGADIYSLGMVLYWMMNRHTLPFLPLPPSIPTGAQRQQAQDRRLSGEPLPPPVDGSEALKKIVLKACAFSPAERYRSAEEMQAALQSCLSTPTAPRMQRQEPMAPPAPISEPTVIDTPTELEREPAVHVNTPQRAQQVPVQQGQMPKKEAPEKKPPKKKQKQPVIYHVMVTAIIVALLLASCGVGIVISSYSKRSEMANAQTLEPTQTQETEETTEAAAQIPVTVPRAVHTEPPTEAPQEQTNLQSYQTAQQLMDDGKYMQAMWAFSNLNYRDSQKKVQEARDCFIAAQRTPSLAAGNLHTVGLRSDGTVVATGLQDNNRCKTNDWKDIIAVSAGGAHSVGLRADGTVFTAGFNNFRQCSDTASWTDIVAISAGGYHTIGLRSNGTVVAAGLNGNGQCNTANWKNIVAVSAGTYHTVGLRSDGTVVTTGSNKNGQCDTGGWRNIVAISAGGSYTVGLRSDGTVVAAGLNSGGQCNVSRWTDIVAISAGTYHTVGLRSDGTVLTTGSNKNGQCDTGGWRNIVAISAGSSHTVGLRSDGTVVATGANSNDQCNVSSWKNISTAQAAPT